MIEIRNYREKDLLGLALVFFHTVMKVNIRDYSLDQVKAWSQSKYDLIKNRRRFLDSYCLVADLDGEILGFGNLEASGYLDNLFVHKDYQGQGLGSRIYQGLEDQARLLGLEKIEGDISLTARDFFLAQGFSLVKAQEKTLRGQTFKNFKMEKYIG